MKRRICYITGTRADFGLMRSVLNEIHSSDDMELYIIVTGMHLHDRYGHTLSEIEASGFRISGKVDVVDCATGGGMAKNIGLMLQGFVPILEEISPDIVILLGDRGEMLAGALASVHLNIFVAHIHGGERSGTIDEPVRHAISKLSHFHFTSTDAAAERLIRMGEMEKHVYVVGAPGLDGLSGLASYTKQQLLTSAGLDACEPVSLMLYHPVLQDNDTALEDTTMMLDTLLAKGLQVVTLQPNSDAGRDKICTALAKYSNDGRVKVFAHLPREEFVSWMAIVDIMIGNSSAGIIEAATFGTPVINVGSRQNLRERNPNVQDLELHNDQLGDVIKTLTGQRFTCNNLYGDGQAGRKIVRLLANLDLNSEVLNKANVY